MPVLHQLQPSFNNGEISPLLYDRVDYQKFTSSVKSGKNMFVHPQGGMSNRAGTLMLGKAKDENVRLIPFEFSNTETYMIEFGDFYCRFYTTNGQVVNEDGSPYEIASPFTTSDLDKIRYVQSGDVMYLAWGGKPKTLTRYGHTDWRFEDYGYDNGPFELENNDKNLSVIYDSDKQYYKFTSSLDLFKTTDTGRLIKILKEIKAIHLTGSITTSSGNYSSEAYLGSSSVTLFTSGTWVGSINLEISKNKVDWEVLRTFSSNKDNNLNYTGTVDEDYIWYRITGKVTDGTLNFTLDTQSAKEFFIFQIVEFDNSSLVYCKSVEEVLGLETFFTKETTSVGDIITITQFMTSNTTPSGEAYSSRLGNKAYQIFKKQTSSEWFPDKDAYVPYGTEFSFGYKPGFSFYCMSISFKTQGYQGVSFNNGIFKKFEVYGNLNNGPMQRLDYTLISDAYLGYRYSSHSIKLALQGNTLIDNLYFVVNFDVGSFDKNLVFGLLATGIKYVPGEDVRGGLVSSYYLGKWTNPNKFPTEVELYQDRVEWFTNNQIDATKISDYTNFGVSTEVTDDDAISVIIKDKKINKINSAIAGSKLVVFTDSGNFIHNNDTFTPNSATFLKQGSTGGADVKPVIVRDNIIYVHPMKQAISDYAYSFETDGYAGQDITILANHLFENKKIKTLAYQQEPYSIIWVLQEEGNVLACTYLRQQNVIAWTPMDFGGKVLSIGVLSNGSNEELYLAVQRKNGTFVEKMPTRLPNADPKDRFFVDCGRTYRGEPANIISGLNHLEGENVVALADGKVVKGKVVTNGQITLDVPASIVTVGLPYESVLETLTFDVSQGDGSNLNRKKRVVAVSVRYNNSRGSRVSVNGHREVPMLERKIENTDTDISLKSGFYREILPSAHKEPTTIKIRQDEPLPITIVSIIPELEYEQ